jgi:propionyl-CoA synthetase
MKYNKIYEDSIAKTRSVWTQQADAIEWYNKPATILSKDENGYPQWYKDGELNICY